MLSRRQEIAQRAVASALPWRGAGKELTPNRRGRALGAFVIAYATIWAAACVQLEMADQDEGSGGSTSGRGGEPHPADREPVEAGSCNAWKVSYCNAVARCSFDTREACELDVGYVMCLDEANVADCAEAIDDATCGSMPSQCSPAHIADRRLPTEVCLSLHTEYCEWSLYCGYEFSLEGCQAQLARVEPCSEFTAVLPGYEQCLSEFRTLSCNAHLPSSCEGLLRR